METDYLTRLYDDVLGWYRSADTKAQLLLTLDGILITVAAAAAFGKPDEVATRKAAVSVWAWVLLIVAAAGVIGSVICAVICLFSRLSNARIERLVSDWGVRPDDVASYRPAVGWWFGFIAILPQPQIVTYLRQIDHELERDALAQNIALLSVNVLRKHRWANRGWILAASGVVVLAVSGVVQVATV